MYIQPGYVLLGKTNTGNFYLSFMCTFYFLYNEYIYQFKNHKVFNVNEQHKAICGQINRP